MVSLRISSDWHTEFYGQVKFPYSKNGRDCHGTMFLEHDEKDSESTLLLAGDIVTATNCDRFVALFDDISERFKQVYVIMGNHEHYKFNFMRTRGFLEQFYSQWDNIKLLENDYVILSDKVALFGATMWTNFNNGNYHDMYYAKHGMADFNLISYGAEDDAAPITHFTPQLSTMEHSKTYAALDDFWKLKHPKKIVLTHHAPSRQSTHDKYKTSPLNPAFVNDMDGYVMAHKPALWIHGHCHDNFDYKIENTRVICNPYGYYGENPSYKQKLFVDI